jgi:preprotein translocase subunit Sec61beta
MKRIHALLVVMVIMVAVGATTTLTLAQGPTGIGRASAPLASAGTAFTYQGQLKNGTGVVNSACDLQFGLWDAPTLGAQVGVTQTQSAITVTNGMFTTQLDFGANSFTGDARWLDIQVACPPGGSYAPLTPRQALTAAPYALFASNASLLDGQGSSAFVTIADTQTISGTKTFADGVTFPDGTTQTTAFYRPALPGTGVATAMDSGGVGWFTSITSGADGLGLISYYNIGGQDLRVLHCGNVECTSGNTTTTADSAGLVGKFSSITIGADGLGLISYWDQTNDDLKVLHCGNAACDSGNFSSTVDTAGMVGQHSSITIGADGLGLISYWDSANTNLKVLHCGNAACSSGNVSATVDSAGSVGEYTAITVGADGLGLISYSDNGTGWLKVLHCGDLTCGSHTTTWADFDELAFVGQYTAITIGADGLGLISYYDVTNSVLRVLHCGNARCNSGNTITKVDGTGSFGQHSSVTIGADGLGLISYYDATNGDLKVLHCGNATCSSGSVATSVDTAGTVGDYSSITIGADGRGLVSYYNDSGLGLKVFHCANLTCSPYTRVGR